MQAALDAPDVRQEEALWTRVVDGYRDGAGGGGGGGGGGGQMQQQQPQQQPRRRPWEDDVVGRALGNRGNARARQGRLDEAVADYNAAMRRAPWSADPVLNRGVALEAAGRLDEAAADYGAVLRAQPGDPSAWNNLGNVRGKQGDWRGARDCFGRAAELAPRNAFAFAAAQRALADFQLGERAACVRDLRALLRRFADFDDARAALAAALWAQGDEAAAEGEWLRVGDPRYRDLAWVRARRAWPPALADALASFLKIETVV
jgi:tetratricopeptide (TPR) repeat protein